MPEPTAEQTEAHLDFSGKGFEISKELTSLDKQCSEGHVESDEYDRELTRLAQSTLDYLAEAQKKFPDFFSVDMEAEGLRRSLSGERQKDFAVRFNQLLYESIGNPLHRIDAIADYSPLQRAIDLVAVGDAINANSYYDRPNPVRQSGDAIIGRAVQNMLEFNMDPRLLRIPCCR